MLEEGICNLLIRLCISERCNWVANKGMPFKVSSQSVRRKKLEATYTNSPRAPPYMQLWRNTRFDAAVKEVVPSFPTVLLHYWQINQEEASGVGR